MSYTQHSFQTGDTLYAAQLNEMDAQIAANEASAASKYTLPAGGVPLADLGQEVLDALAAEPVGLTLLYDSETRQLTVSGAGFEAHNTFVAEKLYSNAEKVFNALVPEVDALQGLVRVFTLIGKPKAAYLPNQVCLAVGTQNEGGFAGKVLRWRSDGSYQCPPPLSAYDAILEAGDTLEITDYGEASWARSPALNQRAVAAVNHAATADRCMEAVLGTGWDSGGKVLLAVLAGKQESFAANQAVLILATGGHSGDGWKNGLVVRKNGTSYAVVEADANRDAVVSAGDTYLITELEI